MEITKLKKDDEAAILEWNERVSHAIDISDATALQQLLKNGLFQNAYDLALHLMQKEDTRNSLTLCHSMTGVWPKHPGPYAVMAQLAGKSDDYDAAAEHWRACMDRCSFDWGGMKRAVINCAQYWADNARVDVSIAVLEKALAKYINDPVLLMRKALVLGGAGLYTPLKSLLDMMLKLPELTEECRSEAEHIYRRFLGGIDTLADAIPQSALQEWVMSENEEWFVHRGNEDAKTLVCFFTGLALGGGGVSIPDLHKELEKLPVHVVYLRDRRRLNHLAGLESLGGSFDGTHAALDKLRSELGTTRLVCIGASAGGYAALLYGIALEANHIAGFSAPTSANTDDMAQDGRAKIVVSRLRKLVPERLVNVRHLLQVHPRPPQVSLYYGDAMPMDRMHAENLNGLPSVRLYPQVDIARHNIMGVLYEQARLQEVLLDLTSR